MVIFAIAAVALLVVHAQHYVIDLRSAKRLAPDAHWHTLPIVRALLVLVTLAIFPPLFVELAPWGRALAVREFLWPISVLIAGSISYTWYRYLTWLDVFEPEKRWALLLVFLLSCGITLFVPTGYTLIEHHTGFTLTGDFGNDFLYSFLVIGMLEELAKVIPYLVLLRFTKQVNEPYDHLLYMSVSALGFAFIENTAYLQKTWLYAVAGRSLYASVAHMCFSSMIGYGVARTIHLGRTKAWVSGMVMFLVASLSHGLYDVWLLAPGRPAFLTTIFFLGTIQIWVIMKNNLVNLSPFAEPHRKLKSTMFRYRIMNAMTAIFMLALVAIFLMGGREAAWRLVREQGNTMLVMLLILAMSFGAYHVIPGYVARLQVSRNPFRWFLPISTLGPDLSGTRIRLDIPVRRWRDLDMPALRRALPVMGLLERRVVLQDDADWYLLRTERQLDLGAGYESLFLMKLDADVDTIPTTNYVRMLLHRFKGIPRIVDGRVVSSTHLFVPRFFAQLVDPIHSDGRGGSGLSSLGGHGLS